MSTNINDIETIHDSDKKDHEKKSWCQFVYPYNEFIFIFIAAFVVLKFVTGDIFDYIPKQLLILGNEPIVAALITLVYYILNDIVFPKFAN
jgi:hypothetical protein